MDYASTVARRLPQAFAALAAGRIHPVHLRIIEDETSILSDADAAKADAVLAGAAPGMTFGELRSAAHKLVLKLDPDAVRKRKEAARREAHVRRFREDSGNAGMVARELPCDEVLASWQHVEQRALDLRAAGMPGTLQDLRVRAYLDLLQERDSRVLAAGPVPAAAGRPGPAAPGHRGRPARPGPATVPAGLDGPGGPGNGPGGPPGRGGPGGPGPRPGPAAGPSLAALVTITVPLDTWQGRSDVPGEAGGFGLLDGDSARDLAAAAARHPRTRWCVTALNPDGTAAAHGCLPGPRIPRDRTGPPGTSDRTATPADPARRPAPARRTGSPACASRCPRSPAAPATTATPSPDINPAANSGTWSAPATPGAPPRAADGPPPAATWTIPSPGTRAASPANAIWLRYAVIITGASRARDGNSNNLAQASSSGGPRPAAPTPPPPRCTRSKRGTAKRRGRPAAYR